MRADWIFALDLDQQVIAGTLGVGMRTGMNEGQRGAGRGWTSAIESISVQNPYCK